MTSDPTKADSMRKSTQLFPCQTLALLLGILTTVRALAFDGGALLRSEFIYEKAPFPSCHASTIVQSSDGTLIAAWFGGTAEKNPDVGIWVSRWIDQKWTAPVEVANGIQHTLSDGKVARHPTWNPVLFQPSQGPLLLFYKAGPSPQTWWGMLTRSFDAGKTWEQPRRLPEGILGPIKNKPIQLANGDILCPTSVETPDTDRWMVYFERTSDLGVTWHRTPELHDGKEISAIQPSILRLDDSKLLAIGRTRQSRIFQIQSNDLGKSWGAIELGVLPNPNSGTDAITLRDGRHALVYNHVGKEQAKWGGRRSPLNLAISKDGRNWEAALVLEEEPQKEFSYPAIIQTSDNLVHVTYTWKREKVKHLVIDVSKVEGRPMQDGAWPK
jgi:predicted neuraminidase